MLTNIRGYESYFFSLLKSRSKSPLFVLAPICLLSLLCLRKLLFGTWTFEGDTSVWHAFFEYFANSFFLNSLALWNPYMNGGEPFWPIWSLWRLADPLAVSLIFFAKVIGISNLFLLHKIVFYVQCMVVVFGVALMIRQITGRNFPALMSGMFFCTYFFAHHAVDIYVMSIYVWPFIILFWLRWIKDFSPKNLLAFCFLIGLYFGSASYPAITGFTILLFAAPLMFLFHCVGHHDILFKRKIPCLSKNLESLVLGLGIILLMSGPFFVSAFYLRDDVFPIARVAAERIAFDNPSRSVSDYQYLSSTGTSSSLEGMLLFLAPYPSMGWILGAVSKILILVALAFSFGRALPFFILLAISVALALGTNSPFHRFVSEIFPPLFYVRNTFVFESFAAIFIALIHGIGWKCLQDRLAPQTLIRLATGIAILTLIQALDFIGLKKARPYVTEAQYYADFDRHARPMRPLEPRIFAMKRTGWYVMEPLLYRTNTALQMIAVPPLGVKESELPYFRAWNAVPEETNRFPAVIGLRTIFWTKAYAEAYKAGETNLQEFLERLAVGRPYSEFSGGQVEALDQSPASMAFQVSAKEKGVLTVHDAPDPDWTAYVDGQKTPIHAHGLAKQVDVPEGRHTVSFVYRPKTFLFALALFWTTAVVVPLIGVVRLLNRHERLARDTVSHPEPSMKKSV